jgi:HEPN domain-containing protein
MAGPLRAEARRWFQQACYDLQAVRWNMQGGFYDTACLVAQQAAEKALKSLLYYWGPDGPPCSHTPWSRWSERGRPM